MKNRNTFGFNFRAILMAGLLLALPASMIAQTKVSVPKNKQKISKDMEIGQKASAEVDRTYPLLNDRVSEAYIQEVGDRLARAVPPEFQHPEFNCRFKIVNTSDINAFALPGCYLYVNRGLIEAAKNEGEMAGVMAHEISHAMLRHGTAQGPSAWTQIGALGAMLGGLIIGAPQAGQVAAAAIITPYSRGYEKNADILGANIMARAGYDPRDLANMFKTIAGEGGGARPPQWLSTHPDPGNRYNYINQEATMLNVSRNPIKVTQGFQRLQGYLRSLPKAKTMEQIEKEAKGQGGQNPTAGGTYSSSVQLPSGQTRQYTAGNVLSANIPANWKDFPSDNSVMLAPEGAYGDRGITHGAMIGVQKGQGGALQSETENYVKGVLQGNAYLSQQSGYTRGSISGRNALATRLAGTSDVTGRTEIVDVYTTQLSNGDLLYVITVVPQQEAGNYSTAFNNMIRSIRINDR